MSQFVAQVAQDVITVNALDHPAPAGVEPAQPLVGQVKGDADGNRVVIHSPLVGEVEDWLESLQASGGVLAADLLYSSLPRTALDAQSQIADALGQQAGTLIVHIAQHCNARRGGQMICPPLSNLSRLTFTSSRHCCGSSYLDLAPGYTGTSC